jgi:hypothetical protein
VDDNSINDNDTTFKDNNDNKDNKNDNNNDNNDNNDNDNKKLDETTTQIINL